VAARRNAAIVLVVAAVLVGLILILARSRGALRTRRSSPAAPAAADPTRDHGPDRVSAITAPRVEGAVLDRETRTPVAGARVYACDPLRQRTVPADRAAITDDEGTFTLDAIDPEATHVQVLADGFLPALASMPAREILLDPGLSIAGVVVDDEKEPVPDATVWAHREENETAWPAIHGRLPVGTLAEGGAARTAADGTFVIEGLHPGAYRLRAAKAQWCFPDWEEPPRIDAGRSDVQLNLWPTHTLVVEHRDKATGEPLRCVVASLTRPAGARLVYPIPGDVTRGECLLDAGSQGFDPETATTRITFGVVRPRAGPKDSDGALCADETRRFPPQLLRCTAPGYAPFRQEVIAKGPGETRIVAAMEPNRMGTAGAVRMEAFFAGSNRPFQGLLQVTIDEGTGATRGTAIVRFEGGVAADPVRLPPGDYKALACGHGDVGNWWTEAGPRTPFTLPAGANDVRVRLELRGNPVRLEVRDHEGRPARGYDLIVNPSSGMSGIVQRWDAPSHHAWAQRWRDGYAGPDLYLPPGEANVCAVLAGRHSDPARVSASGDGSPIELTLTLR